MLSGKQCPWMPLRALTGQKPKKGVMGKEGWENERVIKMIKRNGGGNQRKKRERDIKKSGPYMVFRGWGGGDVSRKEPQKLSVQITALCYLEKLTSSLDVTFLISYKWSWIR